MTQAIQICETISYARESPFLFYLMFHTLGIGLGQDEKTIFQIVISYQRDNFRFALCSFLLFYPKLWVLLFLSLFNFRTAASNGLPDSGKREHDALAAARNRQWAAEPTVPPPATLERSTAQWKIIVKVYPLTFDSIPFLLPIPCYPTVPARSQHAAVPASQTGPTVSLSEAAVSAGVVRHLVDEHPQPVCLLPEEWTDRQTIHQPQ